MLGGCGVWGGVGVVVVDCILVMGLEEALYLYLVERGRWMSGAHFFV